MVLFLSLDEYQGFHNKSQVRMDKIKMAMLNSSNEFHFVGINPISISQFFGVFTDTTHSITPLSNNT